MNRPSMHAIPLLPHATGATAPTSFAGTPDFLLSKNRHQPPVLGGIFCMGRKPSLLCELTLELFQRSWELPYGSIRDP